MIRADEKIPDYLVTNGNVMITMSEMNNFDFEHLTNKSKEHAISFIEGYMTAMNCQYATLQYNAAMVDTAIKNLELTLARLKG